MKSVSRFYEARCMPGIAIYGEEQSAIPCGRNCSRGGPLSAAAINRELHIEKGTGKLLTQSRPDNNAI